MNIPILQLNLDDLELYININTLYTVNFRLFVTLMLSKTINYIQNLFFLSIKTFSMVKTYMILL